MARKKLLRVLCYVHFLGMVARWYRYLPEFGIFWKALELKILVFFMALGILILMAICIFSLSDGFNGKCLKQGYIIS
jgi:hypothetical protein